MSDPVVLLSTGDVVGPAGGVTDNSMVLFSGTSGKLIKGNNAVVTAAGLALLDDVNAAAQKITLGLGNVDNTSDINKPISTATQTALNLKATINSPTFTGDPKAPTPAQFDADFSLVTTAFVKRMGVEFSGLSSISSNTVLTNSSVGGVVSAASAAPLNVTLPPTGGVAHGAVIMLVNAGAGSVSLLASGAEITTNQSGSTVSIVLGFGDTAMLVKVAGEWRLEGGSAALKYAAIFGASLAANGYQRLPSGLIIQWGSSIGSTAVDVAVTFPIAFPSALYFVSGQIIQNVNNIHAVFTTESETTAGFAFNAVTPGGRNAYPVNWFAIGR